jgi:hypothetical protein
MLAFVKTASRAGIVFSIPCAFCVAAFALPRSLSRPSRCTARHTLPAPNSANYSLFCFTTVEFRTLRLPELGAWEKRQIRV